MKRLLLTAVCVVAMAGPALAHFVWIVPSAGGVNALLFLSEHLEPDEQVEVKLIAGATLKTRRPDGQETALTLASAGAHAFSVALPDGGPRLIHGVADLGVQTRGSTPHVLIYYPKAIVGDDDAPWTRVGDSAAVELVPVRDADGVRLRLLAHGKPHPNAEVKILGPNDLDFITTTDAEGLTKVLTATGRYGAWARHWEKAPGERDGRTYDEVRRYATLVFDVRSTSASSAGR